MTFFLVELKSEYRASVIVKAKNKNEAEQKALAQVKPNQWHANPVEVEGVFDDSEIESTI